MTKHLIREHRSMAKRQQTWQRAARKRQALRVRTARAQSENAPEPVEEPKPTPAKKRSKATAEPAAKRR
jgi:hypothetical protein